MLKKIATVVLILLIVCTGTAEAIEPFDNELMNYEGRTVTIDDVVAVSEQLLEYEIELDILAKLVYGEARGVDSDMEKAAVVWTVLNRVDEQSKYAKHDNIKAAATASKQFAYEWAYPIKEDLRDLARDVLVRWLLEKQGIADVGRVLPKEYLWFASHGDGHNWFRDTDKGTGVYWDWSLDNPY